MKVKIKCPRHPIYISDGVDVIRIKQEPCVRLEQYGKDGSVCFPLNSAEDIITAIRKAARQKK